MTYCALPCGGLIVLVREWPEVITFQTVGEVGGNASPASSAFNTSFTKCALFNHLP